jgi:hypothetical protein
MKAMFDRRGYLTPPRPIDCTLEFIEDNFVDGIPDLAHRRNLFNGYLSFLDNLEKAVNAPFEQWVNGSFISKKLVPRDIDVVTFIDYKIVSANPNIFKNLSGESALLNYTEDSNIVKVYPENHKHHIFTKSDRLYWYHLFTHTARDSRGKRHQKGFIKIIFQP